MFGHIHREEAPQVGEPEDAHISEVAGVAPPCGECGKQEAVTTVDGRELCESCAADVSADDQETGQAAESEQDRTEVGN